MELPKTCPECGSKDTVEKYDGDDSVRECIACEAFWYFTNTIKRDKIETVSGNAREAANQAYAEDLDNRYFG